MTPAATRPVPVVHTPCGRRHRHTTSEGTILARADAVAKPAEDVESFTGDVAEFLTKGNDGLPPGDGLATELANSVQHSLYNPYSTGGPPGPAEAGYSGAPGEDILGDTLELVSRNHEATAALFNGSGEGIEGFDSHLPEGHNPAEFAKDVYNYRWDDNGKDAANLTNWIPEAMLGSNPDTAQPWARSLKTAASTQRD